MSVPVPRRPAPAHPGRGSPGPGAAGPGRPRRTGRRPGSTDTRGNILAAARASFGAVGFEATTIRGVAASAGVDPALVHHYFGTKQQLFVSAMEMPVDFAEAVPAILAGPPDQLGERVARFLLGLWGQPRMRLLMLGVVRSAASDAVAAGLLRQTLAEGPFTVIARAIDRPDAALRATLVGSQLVGLAMARYIVAVEPLASTPDDVIARAVGPTIQHYLVGDLAGDGPAGDGQAPVFGAHAGAPG